MVKTASGFLSRRGFVRHSLKLLHMYLCNKNNDNLHENELLSNAQDITSSTKVTSDQIITLFNKTNGQNISLLWYKHRKGRITASKANDILNIQDSTCLDNLVIRVAGYKTYDLSKKECRVKCVSDNEATARDNVPNVNTQTLHVLSLDCW